MNESSTTEPEPSDFEDARASRPKPIPFAAPTHKAVVGVAAPRDSEDSAKPDVPHTDEVGDDDEATNSDAAAASSRWDPIPQPSNPVNPFGQYQKKAPPRARAPSSGVAKTEAKPAASSGGDDAV